MKPEPKLWQKSEPEPKITNFGSATLVFSQFFLVKFELLSRSSQRQRRLYTTGGEFLVLKISKEIPEDVCAGALYPLLDHSLRFGDMYDPIRGWCSLCSGSIITSPGSPRQPRGLASCRIAEKELRISIY